MRPSSGIRRPVPGGRWPPNRQPASTTPPRCCCPTGACCPPGAASAVRATSVGYLAKNGQVFTPPYLYKPDGSGELAPRPAITGAPATIDPATNFQIDTPDAASIRKVALVRLGAVTHSVNMEQRYVPLSFTAGAGALTATAPANADIAPPGVYMLFTVDANGVPSIAKMVTVGGADPPPPPPPPNSGLVGAWGFSEGSGGTTADASGNGNTGTITGATWTAQGRYGNALSFNGTSNVVRVPSSASLNLTTGMTLSAWIRPTAAPGRMEDHPSTPGRRLLPAPPAMGTRCIPRAAGPSAGTSSSSAARRPTR